MTIIQSKKKNSSLRFALSALVVALTLSGGALVYLYNRAVNIQHNVTALIGEAKKLQTTNAELQDGIFTTFTGASVEAFAAEHGLVKDKTPHYIEIGSTHSKAAVAQVP